MAVKTFENAYIVLEEDRSQRVEFQVWPDQIQDSKSAIYADEEIVGRSEPYRIYSHSGPRTFSLQLRFVASVEEGDDGEIMRSIVRPVAFLRSLVYPDYVNSITVPPPTVMLVVGSLINTRCIVKEVQVTWGNRECAWDQETAVPDIADVDLTLEEVNLIPPGHVAVRQLQVG